MIIIATVFVLHNLLIENISLFHYFFYLTSFKFNFHHSQVITQFFQEGSIDKWIFNVLISLKLAVCTCMHTHTHLFYLSIVEIQFYYLLVSILVTEESEISLTFIPWLRAMPFPFACLIDYLFWHFTISPGGAWTGIYFYLSCLRHFCYLTHKFMLFTNSGTY